MAKRSAFRVERDTLGEVQVPRHSLYGAQTQRAIENFPVSGLREHPVLIHAYITLKKAAALANHELGALDRARASAIVGACNAILGGQQRSFGDLAGKPHDWKATLASRRGKRRDHDSVRHEPSGGWIAAESIDAFPVDVFQAGAGTSFNMNCNEVVANLANQSLGGRLGVYDPIHPNDHVNQGQSTNDTFPTATRVAILLLSRQLLTALDLLAAALEEKGREFSDVIKSGRTHLQDAVPVTLGQEMMAYGAAVRRAARLLDDAGNELRDLGIGGTATGTGINTPTGFRWVIVNVLRELTGLDLRSADDLREAMQSQLPIAQISAALRNLALELTRITNDLRLLSSGPLTGLAEIILPAVQPGSSIMPGKVNPSILECMNQICFHVIGADAAVAHAVQAGQLELNVMMPVMAWEVLFSIQILNNFVPVLAERCIRGLSADRDLCEQYYITSPALATALNPVIGYVRAAEVAKESVRTRTPIPQLLREKGLVEEQEIRRIFTPEFLTGQADRKPPRTRRQSRSKPRRT